MTPDCADDPEDESVQQVGTRAEAGRSQARGIGSVTAALVVRRAEAKYHARLRALGAWWRLGSSVLDPRVHVLSPAPAPGAP